MRLTSVRVQDPSALLRPLTLSRKTQRLILFIVAEVVPSKSSTFLNRKREFKQILQKIALSSCDSQKHCVKLSNKQPNSETEEELAETTKTLPATLTRSSQVTFCITSATFWMMTGRM